MLKNYFVLAMRSIMRNKVISFINIAGLSIGVSCCLLLVLYIHDEMSYDQEYDRVNDLYRIISHFHGDHTDLNKIPSTSPPVAMAMMEEVPEVEAAVRLLNPPGVSQNLIKYEENIFYETDGYLADSTLFEVFGYRFLEGNPKKALVEGNSVVITEHLAKKLFGDEPALNKVISIAQGGEPADYKITGVIEDIKRSHIKPNFFISMTSAGGFAEYLRSDQATSEWAGQNFIIAYLRLRPGASVKETEIKMNAVLMKHGAENIKAMGFEKTLSLEPVKDIYLRSIVDKSRRITYIYAIASIAVFILLIACINFMNLATAKAAKRATEIGLRKVMGAFRSSLVSQILGEAMITVLISILISIILVQITLPFFNQLTGKTISFDSDNFLYFGGALVSIALITGFLAGSYPAFYLSSFQPAQVLKSKFNLGNAASGMRKSLVVFQFMIAIVLVCGMLVISKQLDFIRQKNMGFETQNMVVIPLRTEAAKKAYTSLKNELSGSVFVKKVSAADYMPGSFVWNDLLLYPEGSSMEKAVYTPMNDIDYNYNDILNIKLLAGRMFRDNRKAEKGNILINRTAAKAYGFTPEQAIGQKLFMDWRGETMRFDVVGVMEDFHQTSLKDLIKPTAFQLVSYSEFDTYDNMVVAVEAGNFTSAIKNIEGTWKNLVKDTPFEYSFLDENMQKLYSEDRKVSVIITTFTIVAFVISCLGLYGLSSYMAERRTKEIGVRKVMGASVNQIVGLMSKEFIKLVIIATLLATPLALYCMNLWLSSFAYKTPIEISLFVYAGMVALFIALLTISFESLKAASQNPVDSLRNE